MNQELLKTLLTYDPETGLFVWLVKTGRARVGAVAGGCHRDNNGYCQIKVGGKLWRAHRLAWLYIYGAFPVHEIDHVNGVRDDNRIVNLRDIPHVKNMWNRNKNANNKSGFKGVSYNAQSGKWVAQARLNGKKKWLGNSDDPAKAAEIYRAFVMREHGDVAREGSSRSGALGN